MIVNPQSNGEPLEGSDLFVCDSEGIALISVWGTDCNKEKEEWGDQSEVFIFKQPETIVA